MTVTVVHPDDSMTSGNAEKDTGVVITDVDNAHDFEKKWMKAPDEAQAEFGWDLPLHGESSYGDSDPNYTGYMPKTTIQMTFDGYVNLVVLYSKKH